MRSFLFNKENENYVLFEEHASLANLKTSSNFVDRKLTSPSLR